MSGRFEDPVITEASEPERISLWGELASIALLAAEVTWVTPWFRSAIESFSSVSAARVFGTLGLVMLVSYVSLRIADVLRLVDRARTVLAAVAFVGSSIIAARILLDLGEQSLPSAMVNLNLSVMALLAAILWLWWRGMNLAREVVDPDFAWSRVRFGLVMLVLYLLGVRPLLRDPGGIGLLVLFLFAGLLAMALSRISFLTFYQSGRGSPFGQGWLGAVVLAVGVVVVLAAVTGALLSGQVSFLLDFLREALGVVAAVIIGILSIPWLILGWLITPFVPQFASTMDELLSEMAERQQYSALENQMPEQMYPPPEAPAWLPYLLPMLFWTLVLVLAIVLLRRVGLRFSRPVTERVVSESLLDGESLLDVLGRRMRERAVEAWSTLGRSRHTRAPEQVAERVRQIYRELMDLTDELGRGRAATQTPLEYLPVLTAVFPEHAEEVAFITSAYVKVRYGELPESQEEVQRLEAAWQKVLEEGRRI